MIGWLKRSWRWLVGAAVGIAVAIAAWLYRRERARRLTAEAKAEVAAISRRTAAQRALRTRLLEDFEEGDSKIQRIDEQLEANEHRIAEIYGEPVRGMSRDEIRDRLRKLGH